MEKIAILGAGAWGTALSALLAESGFRVSLWTWQKDHARELRERRENVTFLPGFPLHARVEPTHELERALEGARLSLVVVPTDAFRDTLRAAQPHLPASAPIVTCSKGIENGSLMLLSEVIEDVLGAEARDFSAVLSGPSFALEVARGLPTNVVVAAARHERSREVQGFFGHGTLRVYSSDDPIGVQVGGALKNVIAIAAGASDGLGFGHNTRAALITRGLAELGRLAQAKGGDLRTLAGLAGLGDLVLTCTAELSRNRTVGFELGRGKKLADVLSGLGHVAEGVTTARSAYYLAERLGVELPICNEVYRVLFEDKPVKEAVRELLSRPLRREWD